MRGLIVYHSMHASSWICVNTWNRRSVLSRLKETSTFSRENGFWSNLDHTLLKYSVESKMHKNSFLSEAIMEEVIYEDLPSNLCAIRDYIEKREAQNTLETCDHAIFSEEQTASSSKDRYDDRMSVEKDFDFDSDSPHPSRQRPRVPGLQRDIEVLKAELITFISEYGQEGFMPMRKQLRKHGRVDI
ncbi:uncharacterized protein LOC114307500 [Camellia sinensis]|uniref:uncharacterized protein LOC114307500 n=1 Tax=Camellia sinensis TaxID=4442 RepID=UPI0010356BF5|nr:uncharacterized protein LOC114307500 [Camellia sinensis]